VPKEDVLRAKRKEVAARERANRKAIDQGKRRIAIERRTIHRLHSKIERNEARQRELTKLIREARAPTGAKAACEYAVRQLGVHEDPPYSNQGPLIDAWNVASGISPSQYAYWCQSFVNACAVAGGAVQLRSAYTVQVVQWARDGAYGLKLVSYAARQPGDFVYFKFPGVSNDFCDHVGLEIVVPTEETIEGNTSPEGVSGSQNNGGMVARRHRGSAYVVAVVRPAYKS
jgi:hypothetical protein